jgi:hypothetical protein
VVQPTHAIRVAADGAQVPYLQLCSPFWALYHHPGTVRRDETQRFTEEEFNRRGANLLILADQFMPEVAFKLGRRPKYGA